MSVEGRLHSKISVTATTSQQNIIFGFINAKGTIMAQFLRVFWPIWAWIFHVWRGGEAHTACIRDMDTDTDNWMDCETGEETEKELGQGDDEGVPTTYSFLNPDLEPEPFKVELAEENAFSIPEDATETKLEEDDEGIPAYTFIKAEADPDLFNFEWAEDNEEDDVSVPDIESRDELYDWGTTLDLAQENPWWIPTVEAQDQDSGFGEPSLGKNDMNQAKPRTSSLSLGDEFVSGRNKALVALRQENWNSLKRSGLRPGRWLYKRLRQLYRCGLGKDRSGSKKEKKGKPLLRIWPKFSGEGGGIQILNVMQIALEYRNKDIYDKKMEKLHNLYYH